jgi:predicted Rossmann fold nucleotide-binding protein DprA/Smf involved in DNA uptake
MPSEVQSLSPDSQAIALLCTNLALPRGAKPLSLSEWNSLATSIRDAGMRPGDLLSVDVLAIGRQLGLSGGATTRMSDLLRRGGQLAFELERLSARGISLITRADDIYPHLYRERLRQKAPPALYAAGNVRILETPSAAIVGSRDADQPSLRFSEALARRLTSDGLTIASGAARGIDTASMLAAVDRGGQAIGVVGDSLEKAVRRIDLRPHLTEDSLLLLSPYHPNARFSVGGAMGRNRLIYCLAEAAFVVASGEKGGTWEGALENLKAGWTPLFVRSDPEAPAGNRSLLGKGAIPLADEELDVPELLRRIGERSPAQLDVEASAPNAEIMLAEAIELEPLSVPVKEKQVQQAVGSPTSRNSDAFTIVWPTLARFLEQPRTADEVREHLAIELSQSRAWLSRGTADGLIKRLDRPRRYQLNAPVHPSLFDG